ncbi:MAG TPA: ABC transporter permease [Candidatus Hydrogenedentes bacterium]|mgnify:CR=1 FL=1|nr:ABC transporter permease [Candidatus Hydrogenedentota bacterium]
MTALAGYVGRTTLNALYAAARVCVLMVETAYWVLVAPLRGEGLRVRSTLEHFVEFGVHSLPIVALICFLIGAITAMQASYQLARYGATIYIANLVGVGAMRELAPLMTAILITGRSGSAITAEIGTMKVAEEIDALEVMGLNPTKFLIAPKFLAMMLAVPCVTILAIFIMILGGFFLSTVVLRIDPTVYIEQTAGALVMKDLATGMVKSVFFAITICWVGVYRGFQVEGGAEGVGKKTTSSVVTSIFMIIIVDLIFTVFFYFT